MNLTEKGLNQKMAKSFFNYNITSKTFSPIALKVNLC